MATVHIPSSMRDLTAGERAVSVDGATVAELIERLEARHPGVRARLLAGDGLRPGLAVVVDGVLRRPALHARVGLTSEVHFVPAISGGSAGARGGR